MRPPARKLFLSVAFGASAFVVLTACVSDAATKRKVAVKRRVTTTTATPITPPVGATTTTTGGPTGRQCANLRLMPLGDSLTAFPDSYRGPLYRKLRDEGYQVDFVGSGRWEPTGGGDPDSEGHGGYTIGPDQGVDDSGKPRNLDANLTRWLEAARPQVIVLNIGTNDLAGGGDMIPAAPKKLRALVEKIHRLTPNATLVLSDLGPTKYTVGGNEFVNAFNAAVKQIALDNRSFVILNETYKKLTAAGFDHNVHTSDGQHFSEAGGKLFADVLLPEVRAALDRTPCTG